MAQTKDSKAKEAHKPAEKSVEPHGQGRVKDPAHDGRLKGNKG